MITIFKYQLEVADENTIDMPRNAKILTVQVQNNIPCIWAEVNVPEENEKRIFLTYGTGEPITVTNRRYIGTYQLRDGALIFHVYERLL